MLKYFFCLLSNDWRIFITIHWNGNSFNLVNPFNCTSFIGQLFCTSHCTRSVGSFSDDPISLPNVLPGVEFRRQICTGAVALPESGMLSFILQSCKGMLAIRRRPWVLWWESRNYPEGLPEYIVGSKTWKLKFKLHKNLQTHPQILALHSSLLLCV